MSILDKLSKIMRISPTRVVKNRWKAGRCSYRSLSVKRPVIHQRCLCHSSFYLRVTLSTLAGAHLDPIIQQLGAAPTVDDIFVVIGSANALTPAHISAAFKALNKVTTKQVISSFPWAIREEESLLRVQTFLNKETKEIYQPLVQYPDFAILCQETSNTYSTFSDQELTSVTLFLLTLHATQTYSELFTDLLMECQNRSGGFDLHCLAAYSSVANHSNRSGFHLAAKIAQVLQQNWAMLDNSKTNLTKAIQVLANVSYFCPEDTLREMQPKLLEMFRKNRDVVAVSTMVSLLDTLTRYYSNTFSRTFFNELIEFFSRKVDGMSAWNLSRIMVCIKHSSFSWVNCDNLNEKLAQRAAEIIADGKLNVAEVVSLVSFYESLRYPGNSKAILEGLLKEHIDDADVLLLKYISHISLICNSSDMDLVQAYCRRINNKFDELITSLSCLLAVVNQLTKTKYRSVSVNKVLSQYLLDQILGHQLGVQRKHIAECAAFLVKSFGRYDQRSMTLLAEKLIFSTPRFTLDDMIHIGMSLTTDGSSNISRSFTVQVASALARELLSRGDEISSFPTLARAVRSVFSKVDVILKNAIVTDLQALIVKLAPSLNVNTVRPAAYCMIEMRYYLPEVLQTIVDVIIKNSTSVDIATLAQTFDILGRFQFYPNELDLICKITTESLFDSGTTDWKNAAHIGFIIVIANSMAHLQIFPEDLITRIFSFEFLSHFDEIAASAESKIKNRLKKHLKNLNRSVVLHCPHMQIPWFCGGCEFDAVSDFNVNAKSVAYQQWSNVVYNAMVEVLGGPEFVVQNPSLTPYDHVYDFECILDNQNKPVPIGSPNCHQRLAVIITTPKTYCANSRRPIGSFQNKVIQLEILGFRVIVIPYFHLNSMMLSDKNSVRQYFHQKILSSSAQEPNEACSGSVMSQFVK